MDDQHQGATLVDVDELLRNWASYVQWGDNPIPKPSRYCGGIECMYADPSNLARYQYESPPPKRKEPRFADGERVERIITHPDFPAVWRRVLRVEYLEDIYRPRSMDGEQWLQRKARRARVSTRSYWEFLSGAQGFIRSRYFLLTMAGRVRGG